MDTKGVTTVNVTDPRIQGTPLKRPAPCFPFSAGLIQDVVLAGNVLLSRDNLEGSIFGLVDRQELGGG